MVNSHPANQKPPKKLPEFFMNPSFFFPIIFWNLPNLPSHQVDFGDIYILKATVDSQYYRQTNGYLGGGNDNNENGKNLPGKLSWHHVAREGNQSDIDGIEH